MNIFGFRIICTLKDERQRSDGILMIIDACNSNGKLLHISIGPNHDEGKVTESQGGGFSLAQLEGNVAGFLASLK